MTDFYINTETHEIHKQTCKCTKSQHSNIKFIGTFASPSKAITSAKSQGYKEADGCYYCCNSYHIE